MWIVTHDKRGLRPKQAIVCPFCKEEMVFRMNSVSPPCGLQQYVCAMLFKCPNCDFVAKFDVAISKEYYYELLKLIPGNGKTRRYESKSVWSHNELIRKKLKQLGYW